MYTYNNSYQENIGMAPYELLYGKLCQSSLCGPEPYEHITIGPQVFEEATKKICAICEKLMTVHSHQKSYVDLN